MTLADYMKRPGAITRPALLDGLGISNGRLSQLMHESEWPAPLALKLEALTRGAFNASDLSPVIGEARRTAA